jgi:hypothetical protein
VQLEADHAGDEHRHRLAEHRRLRLDAAHAPAEHAQPVDHRGVRVGTHDRVRVRDAVAVEHDPGEVLDVDLVDDAGTGRDDLELVERGLAPAQELVPLLVAPVLELHVALEGVRPAEHVRDHRVVDDQLGRGERIDPRRVTAQVADRLPHGRQVDDARYAREVLHEDPRGGELDLDARVGGRFPAAQRPDVVGGDVRAVLGAEQVLQENLQAVRQAVVPVHGVDPVVLIARVADAQLAARTEGVEARHVEAP